MGENRGFWALLDRLDRPHMYAILLICIVLPLLWPALVPVAVEVTAYTQEYHDAIENVPAGGYVLCSMDAGPMSWPEVGGALIDTALHLYSLGLKQVWVSFLVTDAPILDNTKVMPSLEAAGAEYGVDWVELGYLPGMAAMSSFAKDISGLTTVDFYGTPLSDLPLMQPILASTPTLANFDLIVIAPLCQLGIYVWVVPYKTPMTLLGTGSFIAPALPFIATGLLQGMIASTRGAMEYEVLRGTKGIAHAYMGAISLTHLFQLVLLVLGNALFWHKRRVKGGAS